MINTIIYGVCDPRTRQIRYVGKTIQPLGKRARQHREEKRCSSHRARWFAKMKMDGIDPEIFELEIVPLHGDWQDAERFWISYFIALGARLVNMTAGGEGTSGYVMSAEGRAKIAASKRGTTHTLETRKKLSAINLSRPAISQAAREKMSEARRRWAATPHAKAVMSAAQRGRAPRSEVTRAKISDAAKGHSVSMETRAKISRANIGKVVSKETRSKLSVAHIGHAVTQETREKISVSSKGRSVSPETRAKLRESALKYWALRGRMGGVDFSSGCGTFSSPLPLEALSDAAEGS